MSANKAIDNQIMEGTEQASIPRVRAYVIHIDAVVERHVGVWECGAPAKRRFGATASGPVVLRVNPALWISCVASACRCGGGGVQPPGGDVHS